MKNKLCVIDVTASHYRYPIFHLMDEKWECVWGFGGSSSIKSLNLDLLRGEVVRLKNVFFKGAYWQKGSASLPFRKDIKAFLLNGEPACLSIWLIAILARLQGKKVYFWTHGWYGRETWIKAKVKRIFFGLSNITFTYGNYARDLMIKAGFKPEKISVIYNSLDYDSQLALREKLAPSDVYSQHFGNDKPTLIFIGRLIQDKRLDLILDALAQAKERGFEYYLMIIGDGPVRADLETKAKELSLHNNVWFYGACYDDKLLCDLLYNADLCVSPRNVGLTAIHCLTFGTPVITSDSFTIQGPEFEAIKPGITGNFFDMSVPTSLSDKIIEWFKTHTNRQAIREECYKEISEKWNPHNQIRIFSENIKI